MRSRAAVLAAAAAALLAALAAPTGAQALSDRAGLHVASVSRLDRRLLDITLDTRALAGPTHVRVLLPDGYDAHPRRRYPVLYLLHGALADYTSWTRTGDAEHITSGRPLIVVMPDGGGGGWYVNWQNDGRAGPPEWETYHLHQLIPWVDANFRTRGSRGGRALAGLSMGGYGAIEYAARRPDLFVYAASFSGAVDTNDPELWPVLQFEAVHYGGTPDAIFGPRATDEVNWHGHNPWDLAPNLRGMRLALYTGNGLRGPYDNKPFDPIEAGVHTMSVSLHRRLVALGIPHLWDDYGPGQHSWPYWQRDLRQALPQIMSTFAHAVAPRPRFTYEAIDNRYSVYGYRVAMRRPVAEFSTLSGRANGFALEGSGSATVVTPASYRRRALYQVTVRRERGPALKEHLTANRRGRLVIAVPLGPANRSQEYTPQARLTGTAVYRTSVTISRP